MFPSHHGLRAAPRFWRRIAAAALLALQALVAFSPIAERASPIAPVAHTHDQERHHGRLHDEATCAICASQTHVAEAAVAGAGPSFSAGPVEAPRAALTTVPSRAPRPHKSPRAPPVLS